MTALLNEPAPRMFFAPDDRRDTAEFDGWTKSELLDYAEEHNIEGVSSAMKKAEIIDAIMNA